MKPPVGGRPRKVASPLPVWTVAALGPLHEAAAAARAEGRDPWQFAIEIRQLAASGLSPSDLRRLLCRGLVSAAEETTRPRMKQRTFRRVANLHLTERMCFVLTPAGEAALRRVGALRAGASAAGPDAPTGPHATPHWDRDRRTLFFGGLVVKCYAVPAPNQERVLETFEEAGWPARLDDPLPGDAGHDAKQRLHEAIKSLNHGHVHRLIRFSGDGTGMGICWRPLGQPPPDRP